ncbi:MAG: flagellar biosynthesis protein FlhB [Planctomycetes bacterium]|nr:flagellar biosynthesis protein FlhB [Planctomycetota bacterium]
MADNDSDKTQEATPYRREQAREQGQVARSADLTSALVLLGAVGVLSWLGMSLVTYFGGFAGDSLGGQAWLSMDTSTACAINNDLLQRLALVILPILGLVMLWDVTVTMLQVGIMFLPQKLAPDISRIDPLAGFGRVFSLQSAVRLLMGLIKIAVVAAVAYVCISNEQDRILSLADLTPSQIGAYILESLSTLGFKLGLALFVIAVLDYGFQWWKQEQDLRMTSQEVREELKNLQGDPQIAARRKQVQRELVKQRLKAVIPKADVVITNPTELAVALEYQPDKMNAPVVLAKGAGELAQQIRRLALEHGVTIVERKPLAQLLYKEVDVGRPIPNQAFAAVAEILAYVYQLKNKKLPEGMKR